MKEVEGDGSFWFAEFCECLALIILIIWSIPTFIRGYKELRVWHSYCHICVGQVVLDIKDEKYVYSYVDQICSYYRELKAIPIRERIIIDYYGHDVGSIINAFVGRFTHFNVIISP